MRLLHPIATEDDYAQTARVWALKAGFWGVTTVVVASLATWWAAIPGLMALMRAAGSVSCAREAERIRQRYSSLLD